MSRLFRYILLTLLISCTNDSSIDLNGGYFLIIEGKGANLIANRNVSTREIPSDVISYNFNDQFIIAKQKPSETDNIIFTPTIYSDGRDKVYYWLIVHERNLVLGPLNKQDYDSACRLYRVPTTLKFKAVE